MRIMFAQTEKKIFSSAFELSLRQGESDFASLSLPGSLSISMRGLCCNSFPEDGCLTDKFKVHSQIDNFGAEAELFQTIPFGTEFKVKRRFECASSFVRMISDIDPGRGAIEDLKLEDIVFSGDLKTVRIFRLENSKLVLDEKELNAETEIFFNSEYPALAVQIIDQSGAFAEFGCGNDLWRHRTNELYPQNQARFCVSGNNQQVIFSRQAIKLEKELAMPKRSFRFKNYIAFGEVQSAGKTFEKTFAVSDCMCSASIRRQLRDFLRKNSDQQVMISAENFLCADAGHLERPTKNELLHWSVEDFFEIMLYGSKLLAPQGVEIIFAPQNDNIMNKLGAMQIMQNVLKNDINIEE